MLIKLAINIKRMGARLMKMKRTVLTSALILLEICLMLVIIWGLNREAIDIYGIMEVLSIIVVVFII